MNLSRREFLNVTKGAAAAAVLAGLGLAGLPRKAHAIVGIDDALLGAVVVAVASLGGYAMYNQFSGNLGLQAVGASFGNYVSSAPNRTAAATAAAQIAATYGLTTTQERFATAADSIANGTDAFAAAMAAASASGRLALDSLVSGSGELVGAFRELVAGWLSGGEVSSAYPRSVANVTTMIGGSTIPVDTYLITPAQIKSMLSLDSLPYDYQTVFMYLTPNLAGNGQKGQLVMFDGTVSSVTVENDNIRIIFDGVGHTNVVYHRGSDTTTGYSLTSPNTVRNSYGTSAIGGYNFYLSSDMVIGAQLPVVDRPVDAPDVIGAGWDSVPLGTDMVISPTTGGIAGAGSVPLPTGIPSTAGDYAAALQGSLAGVVPGAIALPQSLSIPVTVATPTGIATMPISEAISTETSLQLDYAPDVPITPVLPPVEMPEGPWTPVIDLPFNQLWPFNMIYSVVELFQILGGS